MQNFFGKIAKFLPNRPIINQTCDSNFWRREDPKDRASLATGVLLLLLVVVVVVVVVLVFSLYPKSDISIIFLKVSS